MKFKCIELLLQAVQCVCLSAVCVCACVSTGMVWSWGDSDFGKLGTGSTECCKVPKTIPTLKDVVRVKCGVQFSVALTKSGEVYTW